MPIRVDRAKKVRTTKKKKAVLKGGKTDKKANETTISRVRGGNSS